MPSHGTCTHCPCTCIQFRAMHPAPCTMRHAPCTTHHVAPMLLHHATCALHLAPCTTCLTAPRPFTRPYRSYTLPCVPFSPCALLPLFYIHTRTHMYHVHTHIMLPSLLSLLPTWTTNDAGLKNSWPKLPWLLSTPGALTPRAPNATVPHRQLLSKTDPDTTLTLQGEDDAHPASLAPPRRAHHPEM